MKKVISLVLALAMCLSLCACGGSSESTNAEKLPKSNEKIPTENTSDSQSAIEDIDFREILLNGGGFWNFLINPFPIQFLEDGTTSFSGTWVLDGNIVKITLNNGNIDTYEFKELNGVYYLMGERDTLYSDVQIKYDEIPCKSVEITLDNWQEYFELYHESEDIFDQFGEPTGETDEYYRLKLKDEYLRILFMNDSEVLMRFTQNGNEQDSGIGRHRDTYINIQNFTDYPLEMVKIQGTLYLVDGL